MNKMYIKSNSYYEVLDGKKILSLYQYTYENKQSMSAQVLTCLQKTQQCQSAVAIKTYLSIYVSIAES